MVPGGMEKIVYVDTNAFLQMRDLKDLPWKDIFPDAGIVSIVVSRPVTAELEKHKASTNRRRRDRARAALTLIDQAMDNDADMSISLRDGGPVQVQLCIAQANRIDWESFPNLDPNRVDDQIVAEAASRQGASLLTHDRGPRIAAKQLGINVVKPDDAWLLAPEKTDDERRIVELQKEVERLEQEKRTVRKPALGVVFARGNAHVLTHTVALAPFQPEEKVHCKTFDVSDQHMTSSRIQQLTLHQRLTYNDHVLDYNKAYETYVAVFESWRSLESRTATVLVKLINTGTLAATDVDVEILIPFGGIPLSLETRPVRPPVPRAPGDPGSLGIYGMPTARSIVSGLTVANLGTTPEIDIDTNKVTFWMRNLKHHDEIEFDEFFVAVRPEQLGRIPIKIRITANELPDPVEHELWIDFA